MARSATVAFFDDFKILMNDMRRWLKSPAFMYKVV